MPPSVRLDPGDAQFVDVIHSDASVPYMLFEGNVARITAQKGDTEPDSPDIRSASCGTVDAGAFA